MLIGTLAAGLAIGLLMGVLGGGGGVLAVPVLVLLLGSTPQDATTGSLLIVGVAALAGTAARWRSGGVRWRTGAAFGVLGVPAAFVGTAVNQRIDPTVLLLAFAALVLVVAGLLLAGRRPSPATGPPRGGGTSGDVLVGSTRLTTALTVVPAGLAVGFLTGLFGVGGGFLVVPALVLGLRMPMPVAVGTSLLAIAINSGASLAARAGVAEFDWPVLVPFTLAAVCATVAGRRVAGRFSGDTLTTAFAVLLIGVAALVTAQSVLAA